MMGNLYTFDDLGGFISKAAGYVGYRYRTYGVETEDVSQELYAWMYDEQNRKRIEKWLGAEPQQTTRVYRSMLDHALGYAEREKAAKVGYKVDDVWWYTPSSIEALLPLALDFTYTRPNGKVDDTLASVLDVRKAVVDTGLLSFFTNEDPEHEDWSINIQLCVDRLGGERPAVGRRRAMSNAQAQAITGDQYE